MTETWIKTDSEAQTLCIPNYKHYYNFRSYSRGGGVSLYIHNNIKHNFIDSKCEDDNHYLWVHVEKFCLDIGVIYKPDRTNNKKFLEHLSEQLQNKKRLIIIGDFNINLLKADQDTKDYKKTLKENGCSILNKIEDSYCTRETQTTKTILDHISTNLKEHDFHLAIINSVLSDHKQIYFELKQLKPNLVMKKEYEAIDYEKLYKMMSDTEFGNPDYDYEILENTLLHTINKNKIKKKKLLNPPRKDWIRKDLIEAINNRNLMWNRIKHLPSDDPGKKEFVKERNNVFQKIQTAKKEYYYGAFKECQRKPLKMWRLISSLSNNKVKEYCTPSKLNTESGIITDEKQICACFNDFFANIGTYLANQIPKEYHNVDLASNNAKDKTSLDLIYLNPTTVDEVNTIVNNLNSNTSAGIDCISTKCIKVVKNLISEELTQCINKCLRNGSFPDSLKIAKVTPIFKNGSREDPGNYRPVSVLPVISKIFEKILHKRLFQYLDSIHFLSERQYGFRPKSNTLSATVDLVTEIKLKIDQKQIAVGVFIDLKKAFDTVSHEILLNKLRMIGITGTALKIFKSYLANRYQVVKLGQSTSDAKLITYGVPQGSILGPLLFLIYVNDIQNIGLQGQITLYADDTCLFYFGANLDTMLEQAQSDLNCLHEWLLCNLLTINASKTKYIIFAAKNKIVNDHLPLNINNIVLEKSNVEKYLGLLLDCQLSWKPHIEKIRSKILSLTGALRGIVRCLPIRVRYTIYNSLVKPHLDYLIELWGSAPKTTMQTVNTAHNRLVKVLFRLKYQTPTSKVYKQTKLMNISQLYAYKTCILIRKILNKDIHCRISFTKKSQIQKRILRRANDLMLYVPRTNYGLKTIVNEGAQIYNKLTKDIKEIKSLTLFKKALKHHFLTSS